MVWEFKFKPIGKLPVLLALDCSCKSEGARLYSGRDMPGCPCDILTEVLKCKKKTGNQEETGNITQL